MVKKHTKGLNLKKIIGNVSFHDAYQYMVMENRKMQRNYINNEFSNFIYEAYSTSGDFFELDFMVSTYTEDRDTYKQGGENCTVFGLPFEWEREVDRTCEDYEGFIGNYYAFALAHGYTPESFLKEFFELQKEKEEEAIENFFKRINNNHTKTKRI